MSEILSVIKFRGKDPRKPKGFSWAVQGGSGGKSKSPRARFLFATFSFGEAKEKVEPQLQIFKKIFYIVVCIIDHKNSTNSPQIAEKTAHSAGAMWASVPTQMLRVSASQTPLPRPSEAGGWAGAGDRRFRICRIPDSQRPSGRGQCGRCCNNSLRSSRGRAAWCS